MAVDFEAAEQAVNNYVADVRAAMPIDRVFLYGSFARGNPREDSDVDLCFFSADFSRRRTVDVLTQLLGLTGKYRQIFIDPRAFPTSELTNDNPFVKEVLRTGRELPVN